MFNDFDDVPDFCSRCHEPYTDAWMDSFNYCGDCRDELKREVESKRLTRHERLQRLADSGCDTWEEARGER